MWKTLFPKKASSAKVGIIGEFVAILYLSILGYKLVRWRYKSDLGEIDIILKRGKYLIFCEVKTRLGSARNLNSIENIVSKVQQRRIAKSAMNFMSQKRAYASLYCRFDVLVVNSFFKIPLHIKNIEIKV